MNQNQERHIIDIVFVIALFCVFALSAVFLITIGANIYGKTVSHMETNFSGRTAFAYITEKIRQADLEGSVSVGEFSGIPALILPNDPAGSPDSPVYKTYLYEYEGALKELLMREDIPLAPKAGQTILPVSEFHIQPLGNDLYRFYIRTDHEEDYTLIVSTKSEGGEDHAE